RRGCPKGRPKKVVAIAGCDTPISGGAKTGHGSQESPKLCKLADDSRVLGE
ncbi:hypothetical protein Dimus_017331, partial [Dionaea muscipula]